ncbi:hypothetical protein DFH09DRAFT_1277651 [Mycena vulgaris]|nr:hypothetical protein DFH09DRAFT_1277651 [Mycena vulgaris]
MPPKLRLKRKDRKRPPWRKLPRTLQNAKAIADGANPDEVRTAQKQKNTDAQAAAKAAHEEVAKQKAARKASDEASKAAVSMLVPVDLVTDRPTKAVKCSDKTGRLTEVPLEAIETAVRLAQTVPLLAGKANGNSPEKLPHKFKNDDLTRASAGGVRGPRGARLRAGHVEVQQRVDRARELQPVSRADHDAERLVPH